jgi:hypothetical protein
MIVIELPNRPPVGQMIPVELVLPSHSSDSALGVRDVESVAETSGASTLRIHVCNAGLCFIGIASSLECAGLAVVDCVHRTPLNFGATIKLQPSDVAAVTICVDNPASQFLPSEGAAELQHAVVAELTSQTACFALLPFALAEPEEFQRGAS